MQEEFSPPATNHVVSYYSVTPVPRARRQEAMKQKTEGKKRNLETNTVLE